VTRRSTFDTTSPSRNITVNEVVMNKVMQDAPRTQPLSGSDLAHALMFVQLPVVPLTIEPRKKMKLNCRERRAAKIAAGKLKVQDGRLIGSKLKMGRLIGA